MKAEYPELGPREGCDRLASDQVLYVREPHGFRGPLGNVEGATLIPMSRLAEASNEMNNDVNNESDGEVKGDL